MVFNTGHPLNLAMPGSSATAQWAPSTCITLTHPAQEIFGAGMRPAAGRLQIQVYSSLGTLNTTPVSCPGMFTVTSGEPAPYFHDLSISFAQGGSNPADTVVANYFNYPAMISAIGQPRMRMTRVGCYGASVCFDVRGNSGGLIARDTEFYNAFKTGADTLRFHVQHGHDGRQRSRVASRWLSGFGPLGQPALLSPFRRMPISKLC